MSAEPTALIVTTIAGPIDAIQQLAAGAVEHDWRLVIVGDRKTPNHDDERYTFLSLKWQQEESDTEYGRIAPINHYARKNVGYLAAIRGGARVLVETDDDNFPRAPFWQDRSLQQQMPVLNDAGWVNVYDYFTDVRIWPRGLPLNHVQRDFPPLGEPQSVELPIQQELADDNPDVDAIYRLVLPLPVQFNQDVALALGPGAYCPFNSQNTTWFPRAFPLMYLPAHCPFRMTDIWRSFVAQRIAAEKGWAIGFHAATVTQDRNEHDLMRDFEDEIPGYRLNEDMMSRLVNTPLSGELSADLRRCYEVLVEMGAVGEEELTLVDAWNADLKRIL